MSKKHPEWEKILSHVEQDAPGDPVSEHVAQCRQCQQLAGQLRELLGAFEAARLPEVPPEMIERTLRKLDLESVGEEGIPAVLTLRKALSEWAARLGRPLKEIRASLVADSLVPTPLLRGGTDRRSLLFETEDYSIAVGVSAREAGTRDLRGQVSPKEKAHLPAVGSALLGTAAGAMESGLSEFGEFSFEAAPAESSELAIVLEDLLIRISL